MTYFPHTEDHDVDCNCYACNDVDVNKTVARELERYIEALMAYSFNNLTDDQIKAIDEIVCKISLLRRYFPVMELPHKHARLIADQEERNKEGA